jgi:tetratricopeptide (TPR) repeat protein
LQFRHSRLRDFFYENIPIVRRRELHRLLAERLEKVGEPTYWDPSFSAAVCYHFALASMPEKELDFMLRGMRMHVMLNHELFPALDDGQLAQTNGALSGKAETLSRLHEVKKLLSDLDKKHISSGEYLKMEATILELEGGYKIGWGQYEEGLQAIRRGLALTASGTLELIRLNCLKHMCYYGIQTEEAAVLHKYGEEMFLLARKYGNEVYQGMALRFLGVAAQLTGNMEKAEKILKESVDLFEKISDRGCNYTLSLLAAWSYIGEIRHWIGELDQALKIFEY